MQYYLMYFQLSLFLTYIHCRSIPFISNVTLVPRHEFSTTIVQNQSIEQCLCQAMPSFIAFNWYSNKTCQLFTTFPLTYTYQSTAGSRLYFAQSIFPNRSKCCMPDLDYLLEKLKNGTWTSTYIPTPRNLILDDQNRLVTVEMEPARLDRFHSRNLSLISRTNISGQYLMAVGFNNGNYFAGLISGSIIVIHSANLSVVRNINSPFTHNLRSIIFLNQGKTMVVSSTGNRTLVFLNQIGNGSSTNYNFSYQQMVNCPGLHGLTRVNDSYFYGTSVSNSSVYAYKSNANNLTWTERLVFDASSLQNGTFGTFVSIDECGRFWFSLETFAVSIFDEQGIFLKSFSLITGMIMDTLITDNYVMFFSDRNTTSTYSRILRVDPHIQC